MYNADIAFMEDIKMTVMHLESIDGINITYALSDIESIQIGKAIKFHSKEDLAANDIRPNDVVYFIKLKSGNECTLTDRWTITYA